MTEANDLMDEIIDYLIRRKGWRACWENYDSHMRLIFLMREAVEYGLILVERQEIGIRAIFVDLMTGCRVNRTTDIENLLENTKPIRIPDEI